MLASSNPRKLVVIIATMLASIYALLLTFSSPFAQNSSIVSFAPQQQQQELVLSRSWNWTKPRRNIMFTKIPKTGSTTLFEILSRVVEHTPDWRMAVPMNNASKVNTCTTVPIGKTAWRYMVLDNGGQIDMFASHACYRKSYMSQPRYWSQQRVPIVITMMRHPISHFISKYRFTQVCCMDGRQWNWCHAFCSSVEDGGDYTLQSYINYACVNGMCNEQKRYMGEGQSRAIVDSFYMVLILERFDESLALLGVKLGLPLRALPYLQENANTLVPKPVLTKEEREQIEMEHMEYDFALYRVALQRLNQTIAELTAEERTQFDFIINTLRVANSRAKAKCKPRCSSELELSTNRKLCLDACLKETMEEMVQEAEEDGIYSTEEDDDDE